MADYYKILGLNRNADSSQIRAAYKQLAMQYHPDRNPNNPSAEEQFKIINEAYHTLSDPIRKSRYDSRLSSYQTVSNSTETHWRDFKRKKYARWQHAQQNRYVFDRNYFKIQGLAFLVFIVMSGICFGIIHATNYYTALQYEKKYQSNKKLVMEVNLLFGSGKIDEALNKITELHRREPFDFQFSVARDSLISELRNSADVQFSERNFSKAMNLFNHLQRYEVPPRTETLRKVSICEYNLGFYNEALQSFKQLHNQQPGNLELVYQIGAINHEYLHDQDEALHYFTFGKKLFKENLSRVYGDAFEVVMDPKDIPDIYVAILLGRANTNIALKKYSEAEKDLNWVIFLRPQLAEPFKLRAITKTKLKNPTGLCSDLGQAKKLGALGIADLQKKYCR